MSTKYRYRPQNRLFRAPLMVLQIGTEIIGDCEAQYPGKVLRTDWRDAKFEDLAVAEIVAYEH